MDPDKREHANGLMAIHARLVEDPRENINFEDIKNKELISEKNEASRMWKKIQMSELKTCRIINNAMCPLFIVPAQIVGKK